MSEPVPRWPECCSTMFMNRAHHRRPRPVGLPPRWRRASATTLEDDPKPADAVAPPGGVVVALGPVPTFGGKLALVSAKPPACICATPRSQRDILAACRYLRCA